jgi:uncharacterized membrane protein YraQ (UPF0718 family)
MLTSKAPWAPIVAFIVASPLTSPSELVLSAGLFGWPFALLYFVGATALGFAAGGVTAWLEDRGLLKDQARIRTADAGASCTGTAASAARRPVGSAATTLAVRRIAVVAERLRLRALGRQTWQLGRRIGAYFLAYSALGYLLIEALPSHALIGLLGGNPLWGVPAAAVLGIPVYLTSEASLPMVAALLHGGLGSGPAMAFLVSGAGTSIGAISGALLIARRRVVSLVVALLLAGAIILGWAAALTLP